ncbi:hypothetical protein GCM10007989_26790 [Devosia pacifica]|uniref:Uncharacterized protein n=1 Tax=Devosia pacifica TaxID=1335967 RepID=A0A918S9B3_9HYPH|nr:hypothetical protein [Devosia pacifica]GHA29779.1 hypothetical protein GCM10007989_26790 [Devosia pacifica]
MSNILENIKKMLVGEGPQVPANETTQKSSRQRQEFERSLASKARAVVSEFQIKGLEEAAQSDGETLQRASAVAESVMREGLSDGDLLTRAGSARFLVTHESDNTEETRGRSSSLASTISARVNEDVPEAGGKIRVEPFVAEVETADLSADNCGSLTEALRRKLQSMRKESENAVKRQRRLMYSEFQMYFSPIWHFASKITHLNRCNYTGSFRQKMLTDEDSLIEDSELRQTRGELDLIVLTRSVEALHTQRKSAQGARLLVPVSLTTLLDDPESYVQLLETIPPQYRDFVCLEICSVPQLIAADSVFALCDRLIPHVFGVVLSLRPNSPLIASLEREKVWGVSLDLADYDQREAEAFKDVRLMVQSARALGLEVFGHNANSIRLGLLAEKLGFTYVDGPAVHLAAPEPRPPLKLRPLANYKESALSA